MKDDADISAGGPEVRREIVPPVASPVDAVQQLVVIITRQLMASALVGLAGDQVPQVWGCLPVGYDQDSMLTLEQFARWQQLSFETVKDQRKAGLIAGCRSFTKSIVRVHPRTFIAGTFKD